MGEAILPVSSSFISMVFIALSAYVEIIKKQDVVICKKNPRHLRRDNAWYYDGMNKDNKWPNGHWSLRNALELTRRPSFGFSFGLNRTPYRRVVALAPTIWPVEFRSIPPRHFDSTNLFRVMGLEMVKRIRKKLIWKGTLANFLTAKNNAYYDLHIIAIHTF